ncbi:MAG TPA: DUF6531 domain-containing protein, partial [Vicinamibacteria bacterium]|nr:DUF6531 domain-containing protein [Vicinamibacteria bacterium]
GLYHVTAEAGRVSLDEPFFAYAFPDAEEESGARHGRIQFVTGRHARFFASGVKQVPLWVATLDHFGNSLSNLEVQYEVGTPERFASGPLPDVYENAKIFDENGDEVERATFLTSYLGALPSLVRLGNVDGTRYKIFATREDDLYPSEPIEFFRDTFDFGSGLTSRPIWERLVVVWYGGGVTLRTGAFLWLGRIGEKVRDKNRFTFLQFQEDYKVVQDSLGRYVLEGIGTFKSRAIDDGELTPFLLKGDGRFEPPSRVGADGGFYDFDFIMGKAPGERKLDMKVVGTLKRPWVNPDDPGDIRQFDVRFDTTSLKGSPRSIWGVDVEIAEQNPKPFILDGNGHLTEGSELRYRILPEELDAILQQAPESRFVEIREGNELHAEGPLPIGPLVLSTANGYDPAKIYMAEIRLLRGTASEVRSVPKQLEFFHAFLTKTKPAPILIQEVPDPEDPPNVKFVTPKEADVEYFVRPTALPLTGARVELFEVDRGTGAERRLGSLSGDKVQGEGKAVLAKGFEPDVVKKEYRAELVVEQQAGAVLRSKPRAVVFSELVYDVSDPIHVTFDVSSAGGPACFRPEPIRYHLTRNANVEIFIQRFEEGVNPEDQGAAALEERRIFEGPQLATDGVNPITFFPGPQNFLDADDVYRFRIVAKATDDSGLEGEGAGRIATVTTAHNVLPVGNTFVKGVDLFDGHLVSSSTDASIAGRGPALELVRTYSSSGNDPSGPMGARWSMNYYSTLIITDCGWTILGGDGSGQSFTRDGDRFVPQKGHHTELVRNADGSFDFYTKGRVRYHYKDVELFEGEPQFGGRPTLEFIEDPNGNRIEILYD